jgi:hypothetical protein
MKKLLSILIVLAIFLCFSSSVIGDEGKNESGKGHRSKQEYNQDHKSALKQEYKQSIGSSYFHRHGYDQLNIPKGQYPPTGECRIWYPGHPAGQQPFPGNCDELEKRVPPGAWLIHHPEDDPEHVQINVYDENHPGVVQIVGEFEIASGVFVRVNFDK